MSKLQIRQGLFETNSSSTHTITIVDAEDFENWKKGKVWYNEGEDKFLPVDEAIEENIKIIENDFLRDDEKLPELFKEKYRELKNLEEAIEAAEDDPELTLDYDDLRWEYEGFYISYDFWCDVVTDEYEDFYESYTTKHGDKVVAFGYYGYGG